MNFYPRFLQPLLMMLACMTLALFSLPAQAQRTTVATPVIEQFYVEPANQYAPGTELNFTVVGSPRGTANVRVSGINRPIPLNEVEKGVYEGTYTIRTRDQLSATSTMRATLAIAGKSTTVAQPIGNIGSSATVPTAPAAPNAAGTYMVLNDFTMAPVGKVEPGVDLKFILTGSPGAKASFTIDNVIKNVPMREVKPGQYEGHYTVRRSDKLPATIVVMGILEANGQVERMRLVQPLAVDAKSTFVKNLSPRDGELVNRNPVTISGTFENTGNTGIDPKTVRMIVSGNDVTKNAVITPQFFTYGAELRPGSHTVEITAKNRAGESLRHSWAFSVAPEAAPVPASLPLQITSHTSNAQVPSGPIEVRGRTAPNASIDVSVQGTALLGGAFGVTQQIFSQNLRADADGNFSFTFQSPVRVPSARFEINMVASKDGMTKEGQLVLFQQR